MLQRASFRYTLTLYLADMTATMGSLYLALLARRSWPIGKPFVEEYGGITLPIFAIALLVWTVVFVGLGVYDPRRIIRVEREVTRVVLAVGIAALVFAGALYFSFRDVSRALVAYFIAFDAAFMVGIRGVARLAWRNLGARRLPDSRVLIVGAGVLGREMVQALQEHAWMGLDIVGYVDDDPEKQGNQYEDAPVLGGLSDAPRIVAEHGVTDVLFALPLRAYRQMANLVVELERLPVNMKVAPDLGPLAFYKMSVETFGTIPLVGLKEPILQPYQRVIKRGVDVAFSFLLLLLSLPAWPIIALLIRLDSPGPAVFKQERIGEGGVPFQMYKFRTMVQGAEKLERALAETALVNGSRHFKEPDDPRVTRVGRLLRRTSLDELPQFWNVLKGDMSLVGPRPELPVFVERYQPWQRKRFGVPQGLTGWWQIHDRSDKPMYCSTEDDLYYMQNYSLLLDLRIMLVTALAIVRGTGAY